MLLISALRCEACHEAWILLQFCYQFQSFAVKFFMKLGFYFNSVINFVLLLWTLFSRCPNLEVISIRSCANVTDASMCRIAFRSSKIRELDISYCYEISHESLEAIGRNCPNLKVLKRNFMNWLDPSQHLGVVPSEYLNACPQDGDSEADAIAKFMPNLELLELQFSKISARGLSSICEGCTKLEFLDLWGCGNLTSRDIANAISNLKNLEKVIKPNFYIPRSVFHTDRYGHWSLYDERFQTDVFRI